MMKFKLLSLVLLQMQLMMAKHINTETKKAMPNTILENCIASNCSAQMLAAYACGSNCSNGDIL